MLAGAHSGPCHREDKFLIRPSMIPADARATNKRVGENSWERESQETEGLFYVHSQLTAVHASHRSSRHSVPTYGRHINQLYRRMSGECYTLWLDTNPKSYRNNCSVRVAGG